MELPIVIDFVCPYCYYLVALLDTVQDIFPHRIRFLPNELTEESNPPVDVCSDPERRARFRRTLAPACEKIGLDAKLPPNVCPRPYTRKAFEGFHFAEERGLGNEYCRRVMEAYFAEERDIGSEAVLAELAGEIGLDRALFLEALKDGTYTQRQRERTLVLRDEKGVLAVLGLAADERVKAGPDEPVLSIKIREI